jgi:transcriptional regulator of acetoin/glycerol metabolism
MADDAPTETGVEYAVATAPSTALGVVVVFSEDPAVGGAFHVSRRSTIGRGGDLTLADRRVSRVHAELEPSQGCLLVTDRESHNGTFVDGERVSKPRHVARVGSTLRLGQTVLRVVSDVRPFHGLPDLTPFSLVGGPWLVALRRQIERLARAGRPVLVHGQTGTGKQLVAEALHEASGRKGELVKLNSAAVPAELMESELFGHRQGAFSGAHTARPGLFRAADGGTLFLDEIGELALPLQAKLLAVVEDGEVRPVGTDRPVRVDVRIVAATHRDIDRLVEEGRFRDDLRHRIGGLRIELPPLSDRLQDVPLLVEHFLCGTSIHCSAPAMDLLIRRPWPGNVRELRDAIARAVLLVPDLGRDCIEPDDLGAAPDGNLRWRLTQALTRRNGNASQVARDLGWPRSRLYQTFTRLGIDPAAFRGR